eukprot:42620-Amphidinium_carterae.1
MCTPHKAPSRPDEKQKQHSAIFKQMHSNALLRIRTRGSCSPEKARPPIGWFHSASTCFSNLHMHGSCQHQQVIRVFRMQ